MHINPESDSIEEVVALLNAIMRQPNHDWKSLDEVVATDQILSARRFTPARLEDDLNVDLELKEDANGDERTSC